MVAQNSLWSGRWGDLPGRHGMGRRTGHGMKIAAAMPPSLRAGTGELNRQPRSFGHKRGALLGPGLGATGRAGVGVKEREVVGTSNNVCVSMDEGVGTLAATTKGFPPPLLPSFFLACSRGLFFFFFLFFFITRKKRGAVVVGFPG